MNVSLSPSRPVGIEHPLVSSQDSLGRSLSRLSGSSRIDLPAAAGPLGAAVSERFDAQGKRVQAAMTAVQHSASAVQTADGFLTGLAETLGRMRDLAADGQSSGAAPEFAALQEQLRVVAGGTLGQGEGMSAPGITFDGIDLFGPEDQPNPPGFTADAESIPKFRLRGGAIAALIQSDDSGNFVLGASDAAAADVLKSAAGDVADARRTLEGVNQRLQLRAVTLQVEAGNISSALAPIGSEEAGGDAARLAATAMLGQPGAALLAQANVTPYGALQLLER